MRDSQADHAGKTLLNRDPTKCESSEQEIEKLCRSLRLKYVRESFPEINLTAKAQRWEPAEVVKVLLETERAGRDRSASEIRRSRAHFPAGKTFSVWDQAKSSISQATTSGLMTLEWITRKENLVICGPSGTGKSHFSEALGHLAVEKGMNVAWFRTEEVGALIRRHRIDDSMSKVLLPLAKMQLVIIDDLGMLNISPDAQEGLYRIIDAAYERRSVLISSNIHPSGFDQIMEKNLATALVDRLLHHAHVVVTEGTSIRLREATSGMGVTPLG